MKIPTKSTQPMKLEQREKDEEEEDDDFELASFCIGGGTVVNGDEEYPVAPAQDEGEGLLSFVKKAREDYMIGEEGGWEVAIPEKTTVKGEERKGLDVITSAKKALEELREAYEREGPVSELVS